MSGYGVIVTEADVRAAMEALIRKWVVSYLAEMDRITDRPVGSLPAFRSYEPALQSLDMYPEDQVPACIIVSPGLAEVPERRGGGLYAGTWSVGVGSVVSGQDRKNSLELAGVYAAAIRALVLQHRSLDGFAEDTRWVGERYDELDDSDTRTLGVGISQFFVTVFPIVDEKQGPIEVPTIPDPDDPGEEIPDPTAPLPDPATVTEVQVSVTRKDD